MMGHKPLCFLTSLLVIIGGLNWGLVGIGSFTGKNLNVVNLLVGTWPQVEAAVYLLVGVAALALAVVTLKCGDSCACHGGDRMMK